MKFEKWSSLGNDYLIIEESEADGGLSPDRVRGLCDRHSGPGADGVVLIMAPRERGFAARIRIFNPDGSEAEVSGNGARQAFMYLRRSGWSDHDNFSIESASGELRASILSETRCRVDMGRAHLRSSGFPSGPDDGAAELTAGGKTWSFQHANVGNPQCAIKVNEASQLPTREIALLGGEIESSPLFPNRTNVSFWSEVEPGVIRARIFERGVGYTTASGTGACGAALAYVIRGGDSPVQVQLDGGVLEVDIDEALHIDLTGDAVLVYRGELG